MLTSRRPHLKVAGIVVSLSMLIIGRPVVASASHGTTTGWAVVVENDSYDGRYADLPAGYSNSTRVVTLLIRRGWPADHILLVRDDLDPRMLGRALAWLASRVQPGDTALLYVAGEYEFFARDLRWAETFPVLWRNVPTTRRVLIVESCRAERLAVAAQGISGVALPAVGAGEWDLWGVRGAGPVIQGGAFTYYLTAALATQPRDSPLAFDRAFAEAVVKTRAYFRTVIATIPAALDAFHAVGSFPERLPEFPNPYLIHDDPWPRYR